jgi:hypothetical protein
MKKYLACLAVVLACSLPLNAAPLRIVHVAAPGVICSFSTNCIMHGIDLGSPLAVPGTTGAGRLISRTFKAEPGTAAAGGGVYIYCVDASGIRSSSTNDGIMRLSVPFQNVRRLPFGTSDTNAQMFVITQGGMGQVAPASASITTTNLTVFFNPPVHFGSGATPGQTSYFFGVVSTNLTQGVSAWFLAAQGPNLKLVSVPATGPVF